MKLYIFIVIFFVPACPLYAIINGSFEQADLNDSNKPLGWQIDPNGVPPQVLGTFSTQPYYPGQIYNLVDINAFDGQHFITLRCGKDQAEPSFSKLTQIIDVNAGQSIIGAYFFATTDYLTWNDRATIELEPEDACSILSRIILAYTDVRIVGDHSVMSNWATFKHTFDSNSAGRYKLSLKVENVNDQQLSSFFAVDVLKICPPGDINGDCKVDFLDFTLLADQWLNDCDTQTWCNDTDTDHSHKVDIGDLVVLAANWLIDCNRAPDDPVCE
jgi:hypothetical protein